MWRVGGDNRAIGYDYDFLENPTDDSDGSIEDYLMKPWERVEFYKRGKRIKLETIDNDKQLILLLYILWFFCYSIFIWFY